MRRFLLDTTVFVYTLGGEHRYRDPCRAVLELCQERPVAPEASVGLLQELAHVLLRRPGPRAAALRHVRNAAMICRLHDFEVADVPLMMTLVESHPEIAVRDAQFAATALNRGIPAIVSADRHFDGIPGLERIDPADGEAIATLA